MAKIVKEGVKKMKIKRFIKVIVVAFMSFSMAACSSAQGTSGTYTSVQEGYNGDIEVEVTIEDNELKDIRILEHSETDGVSDAAINDLPASIIEHQSVEVDTVSGATGTSLAILAAVRDSIVQAGLDISDFEKETALETEETAERPALGSEVIPDSWDLTYDVVVVGGGFAGLSAAYEAAELGSEVLLIDKMPVLGGNSQINGGVYASYTSSLADELYETLDLPPDTAEKHIEDTIVGGDYMGDEKLVSNFVYGAPYFLNLMLDNGLEVRESITRPGGHYGYRTYTTKNGVGSDIVEVQKSILAETDAEVMLNSAMEEIYRETTGEQRVVGIKMSTPDGIKNVKAEKGLIVTTGGFSGNVEMRSKHVPSLTEEVPTTNHVGATGEGLVMAQEIGANTIQMSYIQLYPFADPNNGRLDATAVIPFSGPSSGIIYVDVNGQRYVDEGERRDVNSRAAQESGGFPTFSIFGQEIVDEGGFITEEQIEQGIEDDRIFRADSIEALVEMINDHTYDDNAVDMSAETLAETIETHNGYIDAGEDPDFGKTIDQGIMLKTENAPYYAIPQWPSVHHTMGGLAITENTEVQDIWGEVIPGLYAAGEVTGGVHGTNRLGSNAIPDAAVHGMIAAHAAVNGEAPDFITEHR